ncbi:MAG: hypothetical protein ABNH53_01925 [Henriciella sp.]|jgi:hypothetical protein
MTDLVLKNDPEREHLQVGLLPWEDRAAFETLLDDLWTEHAPKGATQEALVERLAVLIWRRRRFVLAERAMHMRGLYDSVSMSGGKTLARRALSTEVERPSVSADDVIMIEPEQDETDRAYYMSETADLEKAIAILDAGQNEAAYEAALACLRDDTLEWWANVLADEEPELDASDARCARLLSFLTGSVSTEMAELVKSVEERDAVRLQAWGQSINPILYVKLLALEGELDRQFERTLGMLLKLKERR